MFEYSKNIPKVLRCLRQFNDMTQDELAAKFDISKSYVAELESGKKRLNIDLLTKYSETFDFPLSHIMIFSEFVEDDSFAESVRSYLSKKAVAILEFIAARVD